MKEARHGSPAGPCGPPRWSAHAFITVSSSPAIIRLRMLRVDAVLHGDRGGISAGELQIVAGEDRHHVAGPGPWRPPRPTLWATTLRYSARLPRLRSQIVGDQRPLGVGNRLLVELDVGEPEPCQRDIQRDRMAVGVRLVRHQAVFERPAVDPPVRDLLAQAAPDLAAARRAPADQQAIRPRQLSRPGGQLMQQSVEPEGGVELVAGQKPPAGRRGRRSSREDRSTPGSCVPGVRAVACGHRRSLSVWRRCSRRPGDGPPGSSAVRSCSARSSPSATRGQR